MFYRENLVKNVTKDEMKKRIMEDVDFIKNSKFNNSLNKFLSKNEEELQNHTIARFLMISEDEVEQIYKKTVEFLKSHINDKGN
jgi:menaquinone-dependent protoporphyrinogen IX oxidase